MPTPRAARARAAAFVDAVCGSSGAGHRSGPLVVGVNGPQGAGKSTLAAGLVEHVRTRGRRACSVSIDDFYLTHAAQRALAARFSDDPTMGQRGYPGTHDVPLGNDVLAALCTPGPAGTSIAVPRYDKSAFGGHGDRLPPARWSVVERPLGVVILEGWMLGFAPVPASGLTDPMLARANEALAQYVTWTQRIDAWVVLEAPDFESIAAWRVEAEAARRATGEAALTETAAREYIARFEPAYATWGPTLARSIGARPALCLTLDRARRVVSTR